MVFSFHARPSVPVFNTMLLCTFLEFQIEAMKKVKWKYLSCTLVQGVLTIYSPGLPPHWIVSAWVQFDMSPNAMRGEHCYRPMGGHYFQAESQARPLHDHQSIYNSSRLTLTKPSLGLISSTRTIYPVIWVSTWTILTEQFWPLSFNGIWILFTSNRAVAGIVTTDKERGILLNFLSLPLKTALIEVPVWFVEISLASGVLPLC